MNFQMSVLLCPHLSCQNDGNKDVCHHVWLLHMYFGDLASVVSLALPPEPALGPSSGCSFHHLLFTFFRLLMGNNGQVRL